MPQSPGFNLPLSLPRRLLGDLLHFAKQIPSIPVQRRINIQRLVEARDFAVPRPSWCAIFTKAYSLVSQAWPSLRRCYLSFPTPHLYQHPTSVASVAIERPFALRNPCSSRTLPIARRAPSPTSTVSCISTKRRR